MVRRRLPALWLALALISAGPATAGPESCAGDYWPGTLPEHAVDSVSLDDLQDFLDTAPVFDGISFSVTAVGDELWLDILKYPGKVTALASIRTILVIGRVVRPDYTKLVLTDAGKGIFEIPYGALHRIGCQFVWGVQGAGQNPNALNRDLVDAMRFYGTGQRIAPPYDGLLLGDTGKMLNTLNDVVYPRWLLPGTQIE
ncbi:hypothetical protein [Rhizobium wuzhouense]|uniref:Uncharacterized protein n=1 Tax=Rhizobium wuzhouense TaxID=1986026 RepID=A0ABX5NV10_9HYPH|nr:hypothetical protein [Rhizobium wuzhouense]PYB77012.1 hypothetical protein DMY87_01075 [Rhizobium wuzhouense]